MKKIFVFLFCVAAGLTVANPTWAHGGGGGNGGGAGNGGSGSHGGGEGHGGGMGLSHGDANATVSTHGTRSAAAGHKGASRHGHALSARSRSSHLTATHLARAHHLNHALAHNRFARFSTAAHQVAITPDVDTPAEKALPPGIESNVDRGKAVPPGIESKFGPITPDVDTPTEKALPPGIELNVDRGKLPAPETVVPDDDDE